MHPTHNFFLSNFKLVSQGLNLALIFVRKVLDSIKVIYVCLVCCLFGRIFKTEVIGEHELFKVRIEIRSQLRLIKGHLLYNDLWSSNTA
jgi:hypothetical protein